MTAVHRIRIPLTSAVVYCLGASVLVAFTQAGALTWWTTALILAVAGWAVFVKIAGRVLIVEWVVVGLSFLWGRRATTLPKFPPATDVDVISGTAGVRSDGHVLIAAVEVEPSLVLTTEEASASLAAGSALPLALVGSMMHQYGIDIDIDIVQAGCHVPPGTAYRTVYAQFVGPRPLVGQRRTFLVLRLNVIHNLKRITERGPSRSAGPKVLAAAAHRVVQRLQQDRIRAHALRAEELEALAGALLSEVEPADSQPKWSWIRSGASFITTYIADPKMLLDKQSDQWWSWRTEQTVVVTRLANMPAGNTSKIQVGALVRCTQHGAPPVPLAETNLTCITGIQRRMLEATLPLGRRKPETVVPTIPFTEVRAAHLPIGPAGQIIGQLENGSLAAIPLWDQSGTPKRRRIDARVGIEVARQLVLRAVVTGAVVAIHTDDRQRWDALVANINDDQRLFYAASGARTSDLAVFDGRSVTTVPARTVLRLSGTDNLAGAVDISMTETTPQTLQVGINGAAPVSIRIIRTREEDRYLGLSDPEPAQPRRAVSTAPALNTTRRRPPTSPPKPAEAGAMALSSAAASEQPPSQDVQQFPDRGGRHRDIGAPQRIARSRRVVEEPPPRRRPPRNRPMS